MSSPWVAVSNEDAKAEAEIDWSCPDCGSEMTFFLDALELNGLVYTTEECDCGGKVEYTVSLEVRHLPDGVEDPR